MFSSTSFTTLPTSHKLSKEIANIKEKIQKVQNEENGEKEEQTNTHTNRKKRENQDQTPKKIEKKQEENRKIPKQVESPSNTKFCKPRAFLTPPPQLNRVKMKSKRSKRTENVNLRMKTIDTYFRKGNSTVIDQPEPIRPFSFINEDYLSSDVESEMPETKPETGQVDRPGPYKNQRTQ